MNATIHLSYLFLYATRRIAASKLALNIASDAAAALTMQMGQSFTVVFVKLLERFGKCK
jgi:hypothetical protein